MCQKDSKLPEKTGKQTKEGRKLMQDIAELERRITAALERIGRGVEALSLPAPLDQMPSAMLPESDFARLNEALDEEKMLNAQLNERLRAVRDKEAGEKAALTAEVARLNGVSADQAAEIAALRAALGDAEAGLADLRSRAVGEAAPEPSYQALLAEVEALRATRHAEAAELSEIILALNPLIEEAAQNART